MLCLFSSVDYASPQLSVVPPLRAGIGKSSNFSHFSVTYLLFPYQLRAESYPHA